MTLEGTGVRLDVRPISSFLPHEETIPSRVERIADQLSRDGVQKDPIIVDGESDAVLDGMHRLAAFERLRIVRAICCTVDYRSKSVSLHRWARAYSSARLNDMKRSLVDFGMTRPSSISEAYERLEARTCGLAAFASSNVYLPATELGLQKALGIVRKLDAAAQVAGWKREFVPEDELDLALQDPDTVVILLQRLRKDEVVSAARTKRFFPCKTSMHTVDPRPVAVNFPIRELEALTGGELRRRLAESKSELLPPNSVYGGRRYKERLLLLNQS